MSIIKDMDGNDLWYWAVSGLVEGENSEPFPFTIELPFNGVLRADNDTRANVWVRKVSDGPTFTNISTGTMDLSALGSGTTEFEFYVEALNTIDALQHVYLRVGVVGTEPAGWLG